MKRMILTLALILTLSTLWGCTETPPPASTAPPLPIQTTAPAETTLPPETTVPAETTAPTDVIEKDPSEYEALFSFSDEPNWLPLALGCPFERPEEVDLYYMFYLGVNHPGSWGDICDESRQFLIDEGFLTEMDLQIMPADKLEQALQTTFGLGLADVTIPESWAYIEAEDAWCSNHNDAYFPGIPVIENVEDDGTDVFIHYAIDGYWLPDTEEFLDPARLVLHLVRTEDGRLLAISNLLTE